MRTLEDWLDARQENIARALRVRHRMPLDPERDLRLMPLPPRRSAHLATDDSWYQRKTWLDN